MGRFDWYDKKKGYYNSGLTSAKIKLALDRYNCKYCREYRDKVFDCNGFKCNRYAGIGEVVLFKAHNTWLGGDEYYYDYIKVISCKVDKNGISDVTIEQGYFHARTHDSNGKGYTKRTIQKCMYNNELISDAEANKVRASAKNKDGNKKYVKGDYQGAINDYNEAIRLNPDDGVFYSNKASALIGLGRYAEALLAAETSIEKGSNLGHAYKQKVLALISLNRLSEAETAAQAIAADAVEKTSAMEAVASKYNQDGVSVTNNQVKLTAFTKAIEFNSNNGVFDPYKTAIGIVGLAAVYYFKDTLIKSLTVTVSTTWNEVIFVGYTVPATAINYVADAVSSGVSAIGSNIYYVGYTVSATAINYAIDAVTSGASATGSNIYYVGYTVPATAINYVADAVTSGASVIGSNIYYAGYMVPAAAISYAADVVSSGVSAIGSNIYYVGYTVPATAINYAIDVVSSGVSAIGSNIYYAGYTVPATAINYATDVVTSRASAISSGFYRCSVNSISSSLSIISGYTKYIAANPTAMAFTVGAIAASAIIYQYYDPLTPESIKQFNQVMKRSLSDMSRDSKIISTLETVKNLLEKDLKNNQDNLNFSVRLSIIKLRINILYLYQNLHKGIKERETDFKQIKGILEQELELCKQLNLNDLASKIENDIKTQESQQSFNEIANNAKVKVLALIGLNRLSEAETAARAISASAPEKKAAMEAVAGAQFDKLIKQNEINVSAINALKNAIEIFQDLIDNGRQEDTALVNRMHVLSLRAARYECEIGLSNNSETNEELKDRIINLLESEIVVLDDLGIGGEDLRQRLDALIAEVNGVDVLAVNQADARITLNNAAQRAVDTESIIEARVQEVLLQPHAQHGHSSGRGIELRPYLFGESFEEYQLGVIDQLISLRLNSIKNLKMIPAIILSDENARLELNDVATMSSGYTFIVPLLIQSYTQQSFHWVGIVAEENNGVLTLNYIDSENNEIPEWLKDSVVREFNKLSPASTIRIHHFSVEQQRYNNCGAELIENFFYYLKGSRATQEGALALISMLFENSLLDPEFSLPQIMENKFLITELSNQMRPIYRTVGGYIGKGPNLLFNKLFEMNIDGNSKLVWSSHDVMLLSKELLLKSKDAFIKTANIDKKASMINQNEVRFISPISDKEDSLTTSSADILSSLSTEAYLADNVQVKHLERGIGIGKNDNFHWYESANAVKANFKDESSYSQKDEPNYELASAMLDIRAGIEFIPVFTYFAKEIAYPLAKYLIPTGFFNMQMPTIDSRVLWISHVLASYVGAKALNLASPYYSALKASSEYGSRLVFKEIVQNFATFDLSDNVNMVGYCAVNTAFHFSTEILQLYSLLKQGNMEQGGRVFGESFKLNTLTTVQRLTLSSLECYNAYKQVHNLEDNTETKLVEFIPYIADLVVALASITVSTNPIFIINNIVAADISSRVILKSIPISIKISINSGLNYLRVVQKIFVNDFLEVDKMDEARLEKTVFATGFDQTRSESASEIITKTDSDTKSLLLESAGKDKVGELEQNEVSFYGEILGYETDNI